MCGREGAPKKTSAWKSDGGPNWLVRREDGEVIAVEPERVFEHVFTGDDPFSEALEFAAAQLRGEK